MFCFSAAPSASYDCRSADKCVLKVAHMAAQLQMFDKAVQIFEEVGTLTHIHTLGAYKSK